MLSDRSLSYRGRTSPSSSRRTIARGQQRRRQPHRSEIDPLHASVRARLLQGNSESVASDRVICTIQNVAYERRNSLALASSHLQIPTERFLHGEDVVVVCPTALLPVQVRSQAIEKSAEHEQVA